MNFLKFPFWSNSKTILNRSDDPIDRAIESRENRLSAGLAISWDFSKLNGCLLVTKGRGKFLRFQYATGVTVEIPNSIRDSLSHWSKGNDHDCPLSVVLRDLAEIQAMAIGELSVLAGKYVDRILVVGVSDPGIWSTDFDGSLGYQGLCDASNLADRSGINIVDQFPARDIAAGGAGFPLAPLPLWMLFADRSHPVATQTWHVLAERKLWSHQYSTQFNLEESSTGFHLVLPPSDGLDSELPDLKFYRSLKQVDQLSQQCHQSILIGSDVFANEMKPLGAIRFEDHIGAQVSDEAMLAATLALFHIDQMPANVPMLTGARSQRILGQLTPGSPTNYRQLIKAMAQYQPAPMKLRDAV